MTCVITGCALVDDANDRAVWGDLHRIGDCWIFNAVLDGKGEANWDREAAPVSTMRQLVLSLALPPLGIFERRGVIIIHSDWAHLNPAALAYLNQERG